MIVGDSPIPISKLLLVDRHDLSDKYNKHVGIEVLTYWYLGLNPKP